MLDRIKKELFGDEEYYELPGGNLAHISRTTQAQQLVASVFDVYPEFKTHSIIKAKRKTIELFMQGDKPLFSYQKTDRFEKYPVLVITIYLEELHLPQGCKDHPAEIAYQEKRNGK